MTLPVPLTARTALTIAVSLVAFGALNGAVGMAVHLSALIVLGGLLILAAVVLGAAVLTQTLTGPPASASTWRFDDQLTDPRRASRW
ncbi:hypothetical protein ACQCX2_12725 [Propionibacteriaceae bacterium Y1700]|uniref:hypothetical protein n=1 Tax=Microlunatus sp. Y1700 TaxID=3418487 RepID=UPI003DA6FA0C